MDNQNQTPAQTPSTAPIIEVEVVDHLPEEQTPKTVGEISWKARSAGNRDTGLPAPLVAIEPDGAAVVTLRMMTDAPIIRPTLAAAADLAAQVTEEVVSAIQGTPAFARMADLRPQVRQVEQALGKAEAKLAELEEKRTRLQKAIPAPKNLGARLTTIGAEIDQQAALVQQLRTEQEALLPLWKEACADLETVGRQIAADADRTAREQSQQRLVAGYEELLQRIGADLLDLVLTRQAVRGLRCLDGAHLARLLIEALNPDEVG